MSRLTLCSLCVLCVSVVTFVIGADHHRHTENSEQFIEFDTPDFKLRLLKASQTVAALEPKSAPGFDFTPGDRLEQRATRGYHHLGDLTLRIRLGNSGPW